MIYNISWLIKNIVFGIFFLTKKFPKALLLSGKPWKPKNKQTKKQTNKQKIQNNTEFIVLGVFSFKIIIGSLYLKH